MVSGALRLGHDPANALASAHISKQQLQEPNGRITALQMERLSDLLMRELDDEALGWFERRLPWGSYGMLARASITAPTLEVAMKRWCRHHRLLTADAELTVDARDSTAIITLREQHVGAWLTGDVREFCHVSMLRNLMGLASWLVDSHIPLTRAAFAFPPPVHANAYKVLFPTVCTFDQPLTRIHLPVSYLSLPLRRNEAALNVMLRRALPLTVRTYRKDRMLEQRIRMIYGNQLETLRNATALARELHMSERTLHRQLKELGITLQTIKNSIRIERATDLLLRTQQPIKQIALAVGFDNDKGFSRAFKTLTGNTPGQLREEKQIVRHSFTDTRTI